MRRASVVLVVGGMLWAGIGACTTYTTSPPLIESAAPGRASTEPSREPRAVQAAQSASASGLLPEPRPKTLLFSTQEGRGEELKELEIGKQRERVLLGRIFGAFLTDSRQCKSAETSLEANRKSGQIVPHILSAYEGAFSSPGAREMLLIVNVGECGATHADNWGSRRVVVVAGDAIVLNLERNANRALAIADVNGDGASDAVLETGAAAQGEIVAHAELVSLAGGRLRSIRDFGRVLFDDCSVRTVLPEAEPTGSESTSVWMYSGTQGKDPELFIEEHKDSCK